MSQPRDAGRIDNISTRNSVFSDPARFATRYGTALRRYIGALVRDAHDADDVSQSLLLAIFAKGLARKAPQRGRFRDYLKAVARNSARTYLAGKRRAARGRTDLDELPAAGAESEMDRQWLADWRACVLEAAWTALELHQYGRPDNFCHAVLRLTADHPKENSTRLAERLAAQVGRPVRPDAFRKQLSRARRLFAVLVWNEVGRTLADPAPAHVSDELGELGLLCYVRDFLPEHFPPQDGAGPKA
jgi:DNA-directed RNA polymerase specialized sigma24 family protein